MSLKCGIVGLPNVGKSTLFNALTAAGIDAENFPFCTIEPNQGIVPVPDDRLNKISTIVSPLSTIPTTTEFVDIAGLVKGASKGEGLGNQFLSHIRETQAIIHVVRCFEDKNISHVHDEIDPIVDLEVVETELLLADIETVSNAKDKLERVSKTGDKSAASQLEKLEILVKEMGEGILGRDSTMSVYKDEFKDLQLITIKPCLYIANVEEPQKTSPLLQELQEYAESKGSRVLALCNQIEAEIAELETEERLEMLKHMEMDEPGLNKLIRESYSMLNLITFFTAGPKEVRAWNLKKGMTAPEAAGQIHTDFERGFIKAETISFDDFMTYKGEAGAKSAGKLRTEGVDYLVKDGDIMHFLFNV